jgi:hypothetical protein
MNTCLKCDQPLPEPASTGRPAVYCSSGCRRAAELEITRLNRRIDALEDRLSHAKMRTDNLRDLNFMNRQESITALDKLITEQELRLKALLEGKEI